MTGDETQEREYAADVGNFGKIAVQAQILKADAAGNIQLQHAAVNEESAYVNVGNPISATTTGADQVQVLSDPLRFLRWTTSGTTDATFLIDLVAREQ